MAFSMSLLGTSALFKRLAPAVVASMMFGFAAEANAMRYENRDGGRSNEYRGGDRSYSDRGRSDRNWDRRGDRRVNRDGDRRYGRNRHWSPRQSVVIYRGPSYYQPHYGYSYRNAGYRHRHAPRYRSYGRGYGYGGYGYGRGGVSFGFSGRGSDAVAIVGLTALTLAILHSANERQRSAHSQALNRVYSAPVGEPIIWNENNGSGRVTVTRTGTLPSTGQPCREFTQEVIIDGQQETAYGTACRQPDGAWQMVQ